MPVLMRALYDGEADALYIRLTGRRITRPSLELGDRVVLDVDEEGGVIGVEVISPSHPFAEHFDEIARRHGLDAGALTAAVRASVAVPGRPVVLEVHAVEEWPVR